MSKKRIGRPSIYSVTLAGRICAAIADGQSLRQICEADDMPHRDSVRRWLAENADFYARYAQARGFYADDVFDSIAQLEVDVESGRLEPQRAKVIFDMRRWRLGRMAGRYNDKADAADKSGEVREVKLYEYKSDWPEPPASQA